LGLREEERLLERAKGLLQRGEYESLPHEISKLREVLLSEEKRDPELLLSFLDKLKKFEILLIGVKEEVRRKLRSLTEEGFLLKGYKGR
jgi:hypothetical protein